MKKLIVIGLDLQSMSIELSCFDWKRLCGFENAHQYRRIEIHRLLICRPWAGDRGKMSGNRRRMGVLSEVFCKVRVRLLESNGH